MKRVVLAVGLILVAGMLFAAGPSGGARVPSQVQARTGECNSDCDGEPDQIFDQLQIHDRTNDQDQVQDQLHDGSGDKDQDQDQLQTGRPDK